MQLSLCMVVRDEAETLPDCLDPIADLFDDIVVADTGSVDGTVEMLRGRWGITALHRSLTAEECYSLAPVRNELFDRARHPWVLRLDADERLDRQALARVFAAPEPVGVAGYFTAWLTHLPGGVIEDYKLCLTRRDIRNRGLVHDNLQTDIRLRNLAAAWRDDLVLDHRPLASRLADKSDRYMHRLECALRNAPGWYRYHWFMGYQNFCRGRFDQAVSYLGSVCRAMPREFPVECLNSHMVLAEIHAARGDAGATRTVLHAASAFLQAVADDFEVAVNFRLPGWLAHATAAVEHGDLAAIKAYLFAH